MSVANRVDYIVEETFMQVIYVDMPTTVHEVVTISENGDYAIALNARDSYENRKRYYLHALNHIKRKDFEGFSADEIESACHGCKCCMRR